MNLQNDPNYVDPLRAVRPYLHSGEEVLWTGRPYASRPYHAPAGGVVFSIFWLGFAIFWTVSASAVGGAFGLFGLPFVGVGCFLVYTMTAGQKKQLKNTVYAVTDRRAIIITAGRQGTDCHEYILSDLTNVSLESVQGNTGTIRLVPKQYYYDRRGRRRSSAPDINTAFLMIDDVQGVFRLISDRRFEE